jgi:methylenetetrahydrofolate dehydrogenase (NADP+)/methenyltetrahydrofolate cyclohydrolase
MDLIKGNEIAKNIIEELKEEVSSFQNKRPCVVFFRVGEDPASISYVSKK